MGRCRGDRGHDGKCGEHGTSERRAARDLARARDIAFADCLLLARRRRVEVLLRTIGAHRDSPYGTTINGCAASGAYNGSVAIATRTAAANTIGNDSVKLEKRGTTRVTAASAICTTAATVMAGAATSSAALDR